MNLIVQIDAAGWIANEPPQSPPVWQSVTSDEMTLAVTPLTPEFPQLGDLAAVRRYFQQQVRARQGALISCDVVTPAGTPMVRMVAKYRAGRGYAMSYSASLTASQANFVVEVLIRGSEDNFTGVREALVTSELLRKAGPSEKRQLSQKIIPKEWKFERYDPGTRGDLSYLLSDDEAYDPRFPDHPLSRVRRWLSRQERAFQVTPQQDPRQRHLVPGAGQTRFSIRYAEIKPMGFEEIVRELGSQVAADAVMLEALKRVNPPPPTPSLADRQKIYRDQRNTAQKKIIEQQQERAAQVKQVREDTANLLKELTADRTSVWLARERGSGRWHTIREGGSGLVLAVFTSTAFVNDFISSKALDCEPVETSVMELFASLSRMQQHQIGALEFDRCPRCADVRPVGQLSALHSEGELLRWYATQVASRRMLVAKSLRAALAEPDPAKRLATLRYTLEHIDPGSDDVRAEIAKLETAS
ncbi:MAG TPA: hypothetical protein VMH81_40105 [Bryobacteraceae bacterium]|nr:hypothetical protein [Bryobacteraceae bacterium]